MRKKKSRPLTDTEKKVVLDHMSPVVSYQSPPHEYDNIDNLYLKAEAVISDVVDGEFAHYTPPPGGALPKRKMTWPGVSNTDEGLTAEQPEAQTEDGSVLRTARGHTLALGDVFSNQRGERVFVTGKSKSRPKQHPWEKVPVEKTYIPDIEMDAAVTPADIEDFDNLRESFEILRSNENTLVFAIAVDQEYPDANVVSAVKCHGGTAFGGYAYDRGRDSYIVNCVEFHQIGRLPFSYVLTMKNVGEWQAKVPMPERVLYKHFTPQQKKLLDAYRDLYPSPRYDIHFIQMLGCN